MVTGRTDQEASLIITLTMHKRNKHDIVQETIELINNYNAGKERCVILTRNFNEIEPPAPVERRVGDCVREADTLRNKISKPKVLCLCDKCFKGEESLTMGLIGDRDCDICGSICNEDEGYNFIWSSWLKSREWEKYRDAKCEEYVNELQIKNALEVKE